MVFVSKFAKIILYLFHNSLLIFNKYGVYYLGNQYYQVLLSVKFEL